MEDKLILKNHLKEVRAERKLSQSQLAEMVYLVTRLVLLKQDSLTQRLNWHWYYVSH